MRGSHGNLTRMGPTSRSRPGNGSTTLGLMLLAACLVTGALALALGAPAGGGDRGPGSIFHLPGSVVPRPDARSALIGPSSGGLPEATFSLTSPGTSPTAVSLAWNQSTALIFNSYTVSVSNASASGPFQTSTVITNKATTQYAVGSLLPGATYWWMVTESHWGGSGVSNVLAVTQPTLAFVWGGLVASTTVQLNWTDNATYGGLLSLGSFTILQKNTSSGAFTPVRTLTASGTRTTNVSGLTIGASYAFYLNTTDCLGCGSAGARSVSSLSNSMSVGTPFPLDLSVSTTRTVVDVAEVDLFLCAASGGQPSYSYAWSVNGSAYAPGNSTLAQSFAAVGPETVRCQVTDQLSAVAQGATSVDVNPDPLLVTTVNHTSADVGEQILFVCSVSGGTPPTPLTWTFGDGMGLPGGSASHAYTANGTFDSVCSTTDSAGMTATFAQPIQVNLSLDLRETKSSSTASPQTLLGFAATPTNGSGNYTNYTWTFGDRTGASGASTAHAYSAPGNFTVEVRVTDSNGVTVSRSTWVDVTWIVATDVTGPTSQVQGSVADFSASATGGAGGPYNFTWTFGDGTTTFGAQATHTYGGAGVFQPSLTVRDRLGGTNVTLLPTVDIALPPSALAWIPIWALVGTAGLVGAVVTVGALARSRASTTPVEEGLSRWVPPSGLRGAVHGAKVCPSCGAANPTLRRSCKVCGAALPRGRQD